MPEERNRTAAANAASVTGMKTKMKSNELNSIRTRSELVPAVSEKNDRSPRRSLDITELLPQICLIARCGRGPDCPAGSETNRELQLFATSLGERGDRTCRALPASRAAER